MIFLSYLREDEQLAQLVRYGLLSRGIDVWIDTASGPGGDWMNQIEDAIKRSTNLVVLMSLSLVDGRSTVVTQEVSIALAQKKNLVPVLSPGFAWPDPESAEDWLNKIRRFNGVPASFDYQEAFIEKLARHCIGESPKLTPWWKFWHRP